MFKKNEDLPTIVKYHNTIGLCTMEGRGFMFPVDTAFDQNGNIYTINRGHKADPRTIRITKYNIDSEFFGTFLSYGKKDGQLLTPSAIAIDKNNNIYTCDELTSAVTIFDSNGKFMNKWGDKGNGKADLDGPTSILIDKNEDVYISDQYNHRIQKFTNEGEFLLSFGSYGNNNSQLNLPWGITIDNDNNVFVANWRNNRIEKFSDDGKFISQFGKYGNKEGELNRPSSVVVDNKGHIYVADWGNERIQIYNNKGIFITHLRGQATISKWAQEFLDSNLEEASARSKANLKPSIGQFNNDPHEESSHIEEFFWGPTSVKIHEDKLFVTESNRHRVQIYNILS
tara:strand:- start:147 stop:1169 length:1023 start_codon:yes stop_codon:yes gene_type:complete